MHEEALANAARLTDNELVARLKVLASDERATTAALVAHLAELDTRDVHLREGFSSLFAYCREVLLLSEHAAYNRIEVARTVRRFPIVLALLEEGAVTLTTVRLLAPRLTTDNHREVLASARGKGRREVEEILARLAPKPDVPILIRKLPEPAPTVATPFQDPQPTAAALPPTPPAPPPPPRPVIAPLAPERYKLQMTIDAATREKLRLAQDLLRHAVPSGDEAQILSRALDALLAQLAKDKCAAAEKPRPASVPRPGSRHVPAAVRRAVWLRDGGRCAFVSRGGHRCGERGAVEFHHRDPYALGGEATVENIALRCRAHNQYEGRLDFPDSGPHRPETSQRPQANAMRSVFGGV